MSDVISNYNLGEEVKEGSFFPLTINGLAKGLHINTNHKNEPIINPDNTLNLTTEAPWIDNSITNIFTLNNGLKLKDTLAFVDFAQGVRFMYDLAKGEAVVNKFPLLERLSLESSYWKRLNDQMTKSSIFAQQIMDVMFKKVEGFESIYFMNVLTNTSRDYNMEYFNSGFVILYDYIRSTLDNKSFLD